MPDHLLDQILRRTGHTVYVVVNREGTSVVKSPGLEEPFHTTNRKYADQVAREIGNGASAQTLSDAVTIITRNLSRR
jgi:hypothetical protein